MWHEDAENQTVPAGDHLKKDDSEQNDPIAKKNNTENTCRNSVQGRVLQADDRGIIL